MGFQTSIRAPKGLQTVSLLVKLVTNFTKQLCVVGARQEELVLAHSIKLQLFAKYWCPELALHTFSFLDTVRPLVREYSATILVMGVCLRLIRRIFMLCSFYQVCSQQTSGGSSTCHQK